MAKISIVAERRSISIAKIIWRRSIKHEHQYQRNQRIWRNIVEAKSVSYA